MAKINIKKNAKAVKKSVPSVPTDKVKFKAGKAANASEHINCLACMRWSKCASKKKSRNYACTKFKEYSAKKNSVALDYKRVNLTLKKTVDLDAKLTKEERVISQLITRTLAGSGVISTDSRIDDRDIGLAPNFYTWITDSKYFSNGDMTPWAKQIEHPTKLYAEWCPNSKCTDLHWWNNVPVDATPGDFLDRVTFLEYGVCPKCNTKKSEWIKSQQLMAYNSLAGLAGQRSAKTATAVIGIGYDLSRLLKSQNPPAMYGVMSTQVLTGTFAALTFEQAKSNIWNSMQNMLDDSPWFKEYHALLKDQAYRAGIEDVYSVSATFARYKHRNLFYHVSGPNKRTMRGSTRVTAMIDEIGWFLQTLKSKNGTDPERLDARGTHDALDRSLLTVRSAADRLLRSGANENVPMGYMYETSSPSSKTDMIMSQYAKSRDSTTIYGYRMATWEANPTIPRDSPIIVEAYREDPITAQRDYAAIPPVSGHPFIKLSSLSRLFSKRIPNGGLLKTVRITNSAGQIQTSGSIKKLQPYNGYPSVLSLDAGSVNNSFAFSVLYINAEGQVVCPFMGEIFPSPEAPIHFPDIYESIIKKLIEHYNVKLVMSDRWQNIMLLQSITEEFDIATVTRSVKYPDFDTFRQTAIYDGGLKLPMLENKPKDAIRMAGNPGYPYTYNGQPISHLLFQLVAVNDLTNVTVSKPDGGTDDLFRALVLGFTGLIDPEYAEYFEEENLATNKQSLGIVMPGQNFGSSAQMVSKIGVAVGTGSGLITSGSRMGAIGGR